LNKQQKELLRQLGDTMQVENTPTSHGLFDKMKDMFS
jgi:molecular chaperone DnaJ